MLIIITVNILTSRFLMSKRGGGVGGRKGEEEREERVRAISSNKRRQTSELDMQSTDTDCTLVLCMSEKYRLSVGTDCIWLQTVR